MNIFALPGHKIKLCSSTDGRGYDYEKEEVKRLLQPGAIYTVEKTEVFQSSSCVYLRELKKTHPCRSFNTVFFEDVEEQRMEDTMKHPYYIRYFAGSGSMEEEHL